MPDLMEPKISLPCSQKHVIKLHLCRTQPDIRGKKTCYSSPTSNWIWQFEIQRKLADSGGVLHVNGTEGAKSQTLARVRHQVLSLLPLLCVLPGLRNLTSTRKVF